MNSLLQQWIMAVSGYDAQHVFRANQEGPIPSGDFAIYNILSIVPADYSFIDTTNALGDLTITHYNRGRVTVQVDVYASDGWQVQHELSQSGYLLEVREIFQPYYIAHLGATSINSLTELVDTRYKDRYQADHSFNIWNTIIQTDKKVNGYKIIGKFGDDLLTIDATP